MHIPDGFLDLRTCAGTSCLAAASVAWALHKAKEEWTDRTLPLLGVIAAFIFAAQLVNIPIGAGTSAHLFGGLLAAIFVGPAGAAIVLTTVLAVQAFLFQDGGITTLGANLLNMAVIGTGAGYAVYRAVLSIFKEARRPVAAALGSWVAVMIPAAVCSLELGLSKAAPFKLIFGSMLLVHAVVGCLEALITAAIVSSVAQIRPDLFYPQKSERALANFPGSSARRTLWPALALVFGLLLLIGPISSSAPDALESVAQKLHFRSSDRAPLAISETTLDRAQAQVPWMSAAIAATAGTGATGLITFLVAQVLQRRSRIDERLE